MATKSGKSQNWEQEGSLQSLKEEILGHIKGCLRINNEPYSQWALNE